MQLKNVTRYFPDEMLYGNGVQYFESDDGIDFYDSLSLFTKKYKLCIEPDSGIIRSISQDVSALYPAGFTVVEADELPEGIDISGNWMFKDGVISRIPINYAENAERKRRSLLDEAEEIIKDWRTELQLGIISEEDKASLTKWMVYISQVKKVVTNTIQDEAAFNAIKWPEMPVA